MHTFQHVLGTVYSVVRISMKYDRNLGAFGTKERIEIWAEVGRNSGLRQTVLRACVLCLESTAEESQYSTVGTE